MDLTQYNSAGENSGSQCGMPGCSGGFNTDGNQGAGQFRTNDSPMWQSQQMQQGRLAGRDQGECYFHPQNDVVFGITVILVWALLIFGIITLAKSVFSKKKIAQSTNNPPDNGNKPVTQ